MKTKEELRDKYFKECTYDFHGMKKVNMTAHDMFEWFWNNFKKLNQAEVIKSFCLYCEKDGNNGKRYCTNKQCTNNDI